VLRSGRLWLRLEMLARDKHYHEHLEIKAIKSFIKWVIGFNVIKLFSSLMKRPNKLEFLSLVGLSGQV
jgi:hypothetical protein